MKNNSANYGCALAILAFFAGLALVIMASGWREKENTKTDLEIYTRDNIYYIKGLTVTNEVDGAEKRFKTKEELKKYISNLTAKEN